MFMTDSLFNLFSIIVIVVLSAIYILFW
jgi:hypothetical protein